MVLVSCHLRGQKLEIEARPFILVKSAAGTQWRAPKDIQLPSAVLQGGDEELAVGVATETEDDDVLKDSEAQEPVVSCACDAV